MANAKGAGRKRTLTPLEELEVYTLYKGGESILNIQLKFRVSESTINRTVKRIEKEITK